MASGPDEMEVALTQIVEQSPSVVWVATAEMDEILYVNRAAERELGITREEFYADPTAYLRAVHPDDQSDQLAIIAQMAEWVGEDDPPRFTDEYRIYDADENLRWVADSTFPITDDDGTVVRWGGIITDVTERKQYEDELQRQRDSLEILNQMVRHDIRNDLQVILSYAELLAADTGNRERNVEMVRRSAENAVDLTTSARDLADMLLDEGEGTEPVELRPLLERLVAGFTATHEEAVVTLTEPVPDVAVRADGMLASVFRNLLTNAVQHNESESPTVTVSVSETSDEVSVAVADNGPGIDPERTDELFGRGAKGLASSGTGIGLYLVDNLVAGYGGSVTVDDAADGGAVFTVTLPCVNSRTSANRS